jgi:glycoside/pentoside/hexuronide:cation symporter, GPH family
VKQPPQESAGTGSVPFGVKFGYGIGDIGSNFFIVVSGFFLLYFLTDIVGVEPALAGMVLLFPKLWDVVSDPIMGAISDRTNSRWGRRRPYLLFGAVPFGLTFFLMFLAPAYSSELARALQVGLMFALGCTAFTVVNVPYSSMVAEMSDDYNERISITSFRMIFACVGVLLAGALAMPLVNIGGDGADGFRFMGLVLGGAITLLTLLCFRFTAKAKTLPRATISPSFREQVKIALKNYPFLMLIAAYAMQSVAVGILMAGLIYFIMHVMKLPEAAMSVVLPVLFVTAIVFIPIWVRVGAKIGKIKAYRIGLLILAVMLGSMFFSSSSQVLLFYGQVFILGIGFSSFQLFPFAMLPDTIEFDQMKSGMRREGIFSGVWTSGQKLAYSVGPGIIGFALSLSGFTRGDVQPESVTAGIRIVFCLIPAILVLLSFIPFNRYDLTEERFMEIKKIIAGKKIVN